MLPITPRGSDSKCAAAAAVQVAPDAKGAATPSRLSVAGAVSVGAVHQFLVSGVSFGLGASFVQPALKNALLHAHPDMSETDAAGWADAITGLYIAGSGFVVDTGLKKFESYARLSTVSVDATRRPEFEALGKVNFIGWFSAKGVGLDQGQLTAIPGALLSGVTGAAANLWMSAAALCSGRSELVPVTTASRPTQVWQLASRVNAGLLGAFTKIMARYMGGGTAAQTAAQLGAWFAVQHALSESPFTETSQAASQAVALEPVASGSSATAASAAPEGMTSDVENPPARRIDSVATAAQAVSGSVAADSSPSVGTEPTATDFSNPGSIAPGPAAPTRESDSD